MQDAGARRVSIAEGIRRIVRKHDCALPAQYTKHSNAWGHSLGCRYLNMVRLGLERHPLSVRVGDRQDPVCLKVKVRVKVKLRVRVSVRVRVRTLHTYIYI